jgi:hypothetical protein
VLNYVLTSYPERVKYVGLNPTDEDLEGIEEMGIKLGYLKKQIPIDELVDRSFIPKTIMPAAISVAAIPGSN